MEPDSHAIFKKRFRHDVSTSREIAMTQRDIVFYDRVCRFERDMAKREGQYQADKEHLVNCQNASNQATLQNQTIAAELDTRGRLQHEEASRLTGLDLELAERKIQLQQEAARIAGLDTELAARELQLQQEAARIAGLDTELAARELQIQQGADRLAEIDTEELIPRLTTKHGPRTLVRMWAGFGAAMAVLIALDLPWVILNQKYGVYQGHVNGTVTQPVVVGSLWLGILIVEALLLSYLSSMARRLWSALLTNMFVGLVVRGTFNGTSLIMFNTWSWRLAGIDTGWGICLLGLAGMVAYIAGRPWTRTTSNPYVRLES